jgi:hypothetical protein
MSLSNIGKRVLIKTTKHRLNTSGSRANRLNFSRSSLRRRMKLKKTNRKTKKVKGSKLKSVYSIKN